ncbi:hypothetical protein GCM10017673_48080 [Streptosporangium violaceochromogenes]|nr:hypothetical protein GCM10017673_48080 [Streptosporangium violaceochromogenes]
MRMPSMRRPSRSAAAAAGLALAVSATVYGAAVVDDRLPPALYAGFAAAAAAVSVAAFRRLRRDVRRGAVRAGRTGRALVRLERRIGALEQGAGALAGDGAARHAEALDAITRSHGLVEQGFARVRGECRSLERRIRDSYAQIEAFTDLRALVRPRCPLPPLRGWAASPDALRMVIGWILRTSPKTIVECGSGSSSVWIGYVAEQIGATVVALEHNPRYAEASRDLVVAHGLSDVVEVREAPLELWRSGEETYLWYSRDALEGLADIGVVFVDGPPGDTGPAARYPALPLLLPRCSERVAIFLDDAAREGDKTVSDRWAARFPEVVRTGHAAEKGLDVFVRSSA